MELLRRRYLSIDPRTLGVFRVALGALLLLDLARRASELSLWYTNAGLLPNHRLLWRPETQYQISYLYALFTADQVRVAFALTAVINLCFLVGYRTRLMHVLSWFALLSMQTRATILANGGDYVFCTLTLWSAFLPLGARLSLDRWIARTREPAAPDPQPVVSLAALALFLQLSVIYFFNAVHKTGVTWQEGSSVYYLLHQARIVTVFGIWLQEHAPFALLQALSYGAVAIEYALPALISSPWFVWPRRLAIVLIWSLHGGIALLSNLGVFSPTMMVFSLLLLSRSDWELFERHAPRFTRMRERLQPTIAWLALRTPLWPSTPPSKLVWGLRELTLLALMLLAFSQLALENHALRWLRHDQPSFVSGSISYLRHNQGWGMFAPDAPRDDMWLVVDATTITGEHIDPLNQVGSVVADPTLRTIPARLGQSSFFCDYSVRIPHEGLLHDSLAEWIFQHHRRVKRAEERITHFTAYVLEHDSPKPGEPGPTHVRSRAIFSRTAER
ncbi:MAG TPA: HTTM domain-containing protein [Polyangiales bacterium]|nr:HTTM domain-containing protein [Polyangiales bacterium]